MLITIRIFIFLFISCRQKANNPINNIIPVSIATVRESKAIYYDNYPATVRALQEAEIRSQITGDLYGIYFKYGQFVDRGQKLYQVDDRSYKAAFDKAKANVNSSKATYIKAFKDFKRYESLDKQNAISKQKFDDAYFQLQNAKSQIALANAQLETAKINFSFCTIYAPFTGRAGISKVSIGDKIVSGTTLLNIISTEDPIAVDFVVEQKDLSRFVLMEGKKIAQKDSILKLQLPNGKSYKSLGHLAVIDRAINNQSGTVQIRAVFPNPDHDLRPGMTTVLQVRDLDLGANLSIPTKSISVQNGVYYVYTLQDSIVKRQNINIGLQRGSNTSIKGGLRVGQKVIYEGIQRLKDGSHVLVNNTIENRKE